MLMFLGGIGEKLVGGLASGFLNRVFGKSKASGGFSGGGMIDIGIFLKMLNDAKKEEERIMKRMTTAAPPREDVGERMNRFGDMARSRMRDFRNVRTPRFRQRGDE